MNKVKSYFITAFCIIVVLGAVFLFGSETVKAPPDNLLIVVNHLEGTYESPECLNLNMEYDPLIFETFQFRHAKDVLKYKPNSSCTNESLYPRRSTFWNIVGVSLGLEKPLGWKWNKDGTWKEF